MSRLTCLTCQVVFTDNELHRIHFKGDWHRYNLKRKVANLSTVPAEEFETRKIAHEAQAKVESGEVKAPGNYCIACSKSFGGAKAYENHMNSKKHKDMLLRIGMDELSNVKEKAKVVLEQKDEVAKDVDDDDMEVEEVDSDEWDEEEVVPITDCLFCPHHSANMDKNVRHMTEVHSFFLPDPEFLTDLEGLIEYLGAKVGQGRMCLWCSEKSKAFQSLECVQKHMIDKGHCKLKHEGETLIEYSEYYDYSSSYPEQEDDVESTQDSDMNLDILEDTGFELRLPSGATVGHRSLVRYYRQSLNPNRDLVPVDKSRSGRLMSAYRMMGWSGTNRVEVAKKVRDMKFMHRMRTKNSMQVGCKANKLQTYFRDRNGMC